MKVLIIGATGGTGRIMLEKALEQDHEVTALARNPSAVHPETTVLACYWGTCWIQTRLRLL